MRHDGIGVGFVVEHISEFSLIWGSKLSQPCFGPGTLCPVGLPETCAWPGQMEICPVVRALCRNGEKHSYLVPFI